MSLDVFLVRHGKTVFNTVGRLQGWSDSPLTPEGRRVAERLGLGLQASAIGFDAAFSSTAPRAADTAEIILNHNGQPDLAVQHLPDLREYCFGGFEGELAINMHKHLAEALGYPDHSAWIQAYRQAGRHVLAEAVAALDPLGLAENEEAFVGRLQQGMQEVAARSSGLRRVLVVAHGMAITAILKSIEFGSIGYQSVDNASVSRLHFNGERWRIDSVGETTFLAAE